MEVLNKMPEFKKPEVLKDSGKLISEDKSFVVQIKHLQYDVDGKLYPKLNISCYRQDRDGFPTERPKSLNLPIEMSKVFSEVLLKLLK